MEKRLLLAFLLSFLVIVAWGVINPPPQKTAPLTPKSGQPMTDALVTKEDPAVRGEAPLGLSKAQDSGVMGGVTEGIPEKTQELDNGVLAVEFSNLGGTIKKIVVKEFGVTLPVTKVAGLSDYMDVSFRLDNISERSIQYSAKAEGMRIVKEFELLEGYLIQANTRLENLSGKERAIDFRLDNFTLDISRLDKKLSKDRDASLFEYSIATPSKVIRKGNATKFSKKESKLQQTSVNWTGFRDRYFCLVVKPDYNTKSFRVEPIGGDKLTVSTESSSVEIPTGGIVGYANKIYFGPQKLNVLKGYDIGIDSILAFSSWGPLNFIAMSIYKFMNFLYKFIPNWGICILLVSTIIYGAMYPLTMKGMSSMKRMQVLQPQMTKLRDQHKSNPQKLNKEMMELYREHKVNPIGGCFPFIFQMPVFIGLYQVLWRSVSFKGASFLWIKDLSAPDRLFVFSYNIPIIGNELNILPIVMVVIMAIQQRLSAKNMVVTDPAQVAQQKMMMTFFPIFLGFIFYKFASGLCLYFTMFYLFSTLTQWKVSQTTKVAQSG